MSRPPETGSGPSGILVLAKPAGPTSHDMVGLVRRLAGVRRVGHGGTLDPFASGVLPLFLGRATRLAEYHLGDRKAYRATGLLRPRLDDRRSRGRADAGRDRSRPGDRRGRPGPLPGSDPADAAGLLRHQGRRAAGLRARPGRPDPRAQAANGDDRPDSRSWSGTDPTRERPDRDDRGGLLGRHATSGRSPATSERPLGARPTSAPWSGRRAARSTSTRPTRSTWSARRRPPDRTALPRSSSRRTRGSSDSPRSSSTRRRSAPSASASSSDPTNRSPLCREQIDRFRLVDGQGALVAIAAWRDGRIAPDKVLVDARPDERPAAPPAGQPDA